jgi:hypothetical protein
MADTRLDRLARMLATAGDRRTLLHTLSAAGVFRTLTAEDAAARRRPRHQPAVTRHAAAVRFERKRKRKKRKKRKKKNTAPVTPCQPQCAGKVCGADGCNVGGTCGSCSSSTHCNAAGQCVGCLRESDCAERACNDVACPAATQTCTYTPVANDVTCGNATEICCSGGCVDGASDENNCGSCGNACNGQDDTCCGAVCVDLDSDDDNCGECGLACTGAADTCCSGTCVDPANDESHCGNCGNACLGQADTCCGGTCVNRASDESNCGSCGAVCTGSDTCQDGLCCTVCAGGCPFSTIQAAINAAGVGATIRICPGTYVERLTISTTLTLLGMGTDRAATVISNPVGPIIIVSTVSVTLRNLKVAGATDQSVGAAILSDGTLTLDRVEVSGNHRGFGATVLGAGISNSGTVTLTDCLVSDNQANRGAGLINVGAVTLVRSDVESNLAAQGAGAYNGPGATLTLNEGSHIRSNQAPGGTGGGVYNEGTVIITGNSTILGNGPDNCVNASGGMGCPA